MGLYGTWSVLGGTGWYLLVLGQFNLILLGIKWYWISIGLLCLCILKKVEILSGVTISGQTDDKQGTIELLSHWTEG